MLPCWGTCHAPWATNLHTPTYQLYFVMVEVYAILNIYKQPCQFHFVGCIWVFFHYNDNPPLFWFSRSPISLVLLYPFSSFSNVSIQIQITIASTIMIVPTPIIKCVSTENSFCMKWAVTSIWQKVKQRHPTHHCTAVYSLHFKLFILHFTFYTLYFFLYNTNLAISNLTKCKIAKKISQLVTTMSHDCSSASPVLGLHLIKLGTQLNLQYYGPTWPELLFGPYGSVFWTC